MRRSIALVVIGVVLVALTLAWTIGPLAGTLDPASLAERAARLRDWPAAPFAVVAFFVVGNFVAAPSTLMIATTILLFGPWHGAAYAYAGMLVSGSVIYAVGRFAARAPVERWLERRGDPRMARFHERVARHALLAVALLRVTPIPYPLQNVVLGAARIGYRDFAFGTLLGILPITLVLAGIATQLDAWIATPDPLHAASLIAAAVLLVGGVWMLRRWLVRRR
jgi:uncharacterized membrane protein YdjX (TVP38/TMEM64 family)